MGLRDYASNFASDKLRSLLGISTYDVQPSNGPDLDDESVKAIREATGGNLSPIPTTKVRWQLTELENAQHQADAGNIGPAAILFKAMRRDGMIGGLIGTLTSGVVRLPKHFYGHPEIVAALDYHNGSRSVFDDMFPPSELSLLAGDGHVIGVGVGELIPVKGRDFPVLCRLEPQYLNFRWNENRWYYQSRAGNLPITPGDGRWILHTPGGRVSPWASRCWPSLGRSQINKEHALQHRANFSAKLANPARMAYAPAGATEVQRKGFLAQIIAWGINSVFELPPGWEVKLIESNGRGYEVFQSEIDTSDKEIMISLAGQIVTVEGSSGFANADVYSTIRSDIIKDTADSLAYTLNTQGIPQWVLTHYGEDALENGAVIEYDVKKPKDLASTASTMGIVASAVTSLTESLEPHGLKPDVRQIVTSFGIPIAAEPDDVPEDNMEYIEQEPDQVELEREPADAGAEDEAMGEAA